jgi:ATP-binding cassette subfamily G (WHITE) protein 2 (SNQ2)
MVGRLQKLHNVLEGAHCLKIPQLYPHTSHRLPMIRAFVGNIARGVNATLADPVYREDRMAEYEEMRKKLSRLSMQRTHSRAPTANRERLGLVRTVTSRRARRQATRTATVTSDAADDGVEAGDSAVEEDADFDVGAFLKEGHFEKRTEAGESARKVKIVYKNLTVKGVGASMAFVKTTPYAVLGTFGLDLYHVLCRFILALRFGRYPPTRTLIHDFSGVVRDGEMRLALEREGSDCSTFPQSHRK